MSVKIKWPPPPYKPKFGPDGTRQLIDGLPIEVKLRRFKTDYTLRGDFLVRCCDCGLIHFNTVEVMRIKQGKRGEASWWLHVRPHRLPKSLKPKRKR